MYQKQFGDLQGASKDLIATIRVGNSGSLPEEERAEVGMMAAAHTLPAGHSTAAAAAADKPAAGDKPVAVDDNPETLGDQWLAVGEIAADDNPLPDPRNVGDSWHSLVACNTQ